MLAMTREAALAELDDDIDLNRVYLHPDQSPQGHRLWPGMLQQALEHHDAHWLAEAVNHSTLWRPTHLQVSTEDRRLHQVTTTPIEWQFHAVTEFMRYEVRGLCLRALREHRRLILKEWRQHGLSVGSRMQVVGQSVDVSDLLQEQRENRGLISFLGLPVNDQVPTIVLELD